MGPRRTELSIMVVPVTAQAAPHSAMQVTVSGNNVGKTTSILSRASSDGARCSTLAAGYHHH